MSSILLKVFLNWFLILKLDMGIAGITLSTSFVTLFNAIGLGIFIRKKIILDYWILFKNFLKMLMAGCLTFYLCFVFCNMFDKLILPKYIFELAKILTITSASFIIYIIFSLAFKMDYAEELLNRFSKKRR